MAARWPDADDTDPQPSSVCLSEHFIRLLA